MISKKPERKITSNSSPLIALQNIGMTGYEARALGYSIFTEGETIEDIRRAVRDAVVCHFEQEEMPAFVRLHLKQ